MDDAYTVKKFKGGKAVCPVCKCICANDIDKHRHMEEKHTMPNVDQSLQEKVEGKELLNG